MGTHDSTIEHDEIPDLGLDSDFLLDSRTYTVRIVAEKGTETVYIFTYRKQ